MSAYFCSLRLPPILLFTFCLATQADSPHLSVCPVLPFGICSLFLSTSFNLDMICHVTRRIWVSLLSTCGKYYLSGVVGVRFSHHFLDILEKLLVINRFQPCYSLMSAYFAHVHHFFWGWLERGKKMFTKTVFFVMRCQFISCLFLITPGNYYLFFLRIYTMIHHSYTVYC